VGALYVRGGSDRPLVKPLIRGASQEGGLRPGTLNVPAIVGFGVACLLLAESLSEEARRMKSLRDRLESSILGRLPGVTVQGDLDERLPGTTSLTFPGVAGDALILNLPSLALGFGSACNSGTAGPSHVLMALGMCREDAESTIRACVGRFTTVEEVDVAADLISRAYERLVCM